MKTEQKRLALIILDIVAIIAILGIVLLDDMSREHEKSEFQKLITGETHWGEDQMCGAIKCFETPTTRAQYIGQSHAGYTVCKCPNGDTYSITRFTGAPETVLN
jgi:hypothetical protein